MEGEAWRLQGELGKIFLSRRGRKQTNAARFLKMRGLWLATVVVSRGKREGEGECTRSAGDRDLGRDADVSSTASHA